MLPILGKTYLTTDGDIVKVFELGARPQTYNFPTWYGVVAKNNPKGRSEFIISGKDEDLKEVYHA